MYNFYLGIFGGFLYNLNSLFGLVCLQSVIFTAAFLAIDFSVAFVFSVSCMEGIVIML